jgi:hypothetical protein
LVGKIAPTCTASGECQQKTEDPQELVVPQDVPGTFEDITDVYHFRFSFQEVFP